MKNLNATIVRLVKTCKSVKKALTPVQDSSYKFSQNYFE
jgi:hypothetical protein